MLKPLTFDVAKSSVKMQRENHENKPT